MTPLVLSRRDTAAALNISVKTLERLEARGEAPRRVQISERRFGYPTSEIESFLKRKLAVGAEQESGS
jgi:predicted DNA-binding transcriptional regulator AlpA